VRVPKGIWERVARLSEYVETHLQNERYRQASGELATALEQSAVSLVGAISSAALDDPEAFSECGCDALEPVLAVAAQLEAINETLGAMAQADGVPE